MIKFFKNNTFLLGMLQAVISTSLLEYIILPMLNMSSTFMFFAGTILIYFLIMANWYTIKKLILNK